MDKGSDGLGADLSDGFFVVHATDAGVGGFTVGTAATELGDLVETPLLLAAAALGTAALATRSGQALEHPVACKGPGGGLFGRRFVDIFSSVGSEEDGLEAERNAGGGSWFSHCHFLVRS